MIKIMEDAQVLDQEPVAWQTYLLRLRAPRIAREVQAGQFCMLQVRKGQDPLLRRPFSFHRVDRHQGIVQILYRVVGRGTWWLSQCDSGTRLNIIGPLGNGFVLPGAAMGSVVVAAGGIGIAPLVQLLENLLEFDTSREKPGNVHLFYGAGTSEEFISATVFQAPGVTVHWSTDDGSRGYHGVVTRLLADVIHEEKIDPCMVYSCGPLAMQYHVARWVLEKGIPSQLSLESLMACGLGACLGCALPALDPTDPSGDHYLHVCKDGPIFKAERIQWHKIQTHPATPPTFLFS